MQSAPIETAFGPSALWALCSLGRRRLTRLELLDALVGLEAARELPEPRGTFVPVFELQHGTHDWRDEVAVLDRRFPGQVGDPLFQHPITGRLRAADRELSHHAADVTFCDP